jgi:hypothetical protein
MIKHLPPLAAFEFTESVQADFAQPLAVFRSLFEQMPDMIEILPTENYLYFSCRDAAGVQWRGNFCIRANAAASGLPFYYEKQGRGEESKYLLIGRGHGLNLVRHDPFLYELRWNGRALEMRLNKPRLSSPAKAKLRDSEVYVGPSYDESGLQFSLLFDLAANCFLWILNDDEAPPEEFLAVSAAIERGARTQFAFLKDPVNQRRVLVGVADQEIEANSYYDGPFDQLPDNFIATGEVDLRKYIEMQNPDREGQIDEFGCFKLMPGCRVAITPYYAYQDLAELAAITPEEFYTRVLKEMNDF